MPLSSSSSRITRNTPNYVYAKQQKTRSERRCRQIVVVKLRYGGGLLFFCVSWLSLLTLVVVVQLGEEIVQHAALSGHAHGWLLAVAVELPAKVAPATAALGKGWEHLAS